MNVEFRVEGLPPSYNKSFNINYSFKECYLSPEAHSFKNRVKIKAPPFAGTTTASLFRVEVTYVYQWYHKNGRLRKIDTANCDKLLYDALSESYGIDDSRFKERMTKDMHSENEEYTVVSLQEL